MKPSEPSRILIGTVGYIVVTFATQGTSHFALNREHYAAVTFMRTNPAFALGLSSMIIQGAILTYLYPFYARGASNWLRGFGFGILLGFFFVSYPALAEPAKFQVPSLLSWIAVEGITGLLQFGVFGLILGILYPQNTGEICPDAKNSYDRV